MISPRQPTSPHVRAFPMANPLRAVVQRPASYFSRRKNSWGARSPVNSCQSSEASQVSAGSVESNEEHDEELFGGRITWTPSQEAILLEPYTYLCERKGKNIRGKLVDSFNEWLQVPEEKLAIIKDVVGMLHNASLLIDDIEDFSTLRRGLPVAHSIFGEAQTINCGNYVYFLALQEVLRLNNLKAVQAFTEELLSLHRGQGMDLFWRDSFVCPSQREYVQMVAQKTGGLFRLALGLMQAESECMLNLAPLADLLGIIFQIRDDYMNLASSKYTDEKGLAEDLTEGKFSFPIIHAIKADASNHTIINILKQRTTDEDVKKYAVSYMETVGSLENCRLVLRDLMKRARALVHEFRCQEGGGKGISVILDALDIDTSL